jgi:hypothetical protein
MDASSERLLPYLIDERVKPPRRCNHLQHLDSDEAPTATTFTDGMFTLTVYCVLNENQMLRNGTMWKAYVSGSCHHMDEFTGVVDAEIKPTNRLSNH